VLRTTNRRCRAMVDDGNGDGVLMYDDERRCSMRATVGA
jgi:hypothetical protein